MNRPRLCILPALVLLFTLGFIDVVIRAISGGGENLLMKLFHLALAVTHTDTLYNPLFVDNGQITMEMKTEEGIPIYVPVYHETAAVLW